MEEGNEDNYTIKSIFGFTNVVWEIENFLVSTCKKNCIIQSPEFIVEGPQITKWRLCLKVMNSPEFRIASTQLERLQCDSFTDTVIVNWKLCYPYGRGNKFMTESTFEFKINSSAAKDIAKIDILERWLVRSGTNTFVVKCSMFVYIIDNKKILSRSKDKGLKSLSEDLNVLLRLSYGADTLLKIGYKEKIHVHESIICSRNKVLKTLIERHGCSVRLDYPNMDLKTIENIISYLYTGDLKYILRQPSFGMMQAINFFNINVLTPYFVADELTLRTSFPAEECYFLWKIPLTELSEKDFFKSPYVHFQNEIFHIILHPKGIGGGQRYMSIYLHFEEEIKIQDIYLQFGIIDSLFQRQEQKVLLWSAESNVELGFKNFISNDILKNPFYVPLDELKIFCELQIPSGNNSNMSVVIDKICPPLVVEKEKHYVLLSKQIASLFTSGDYSDFTVISLKSSYRVHKRIICCRSHMMKNKIHDDINATSLTLLCSDDGTMRRILHYIYSGTVGDYTTDEVMRLYDKATDYAMFTLKYLCSRILSERLQTENIIAILFKAHKYKDLRLKYLALKFICENIKDVESLNTWKLFKDEASELYKEYMNFKYS